MDDIRPPQQRGSRPPGHGRPGGQNPQGQPMGGAYQPEQSYSARVEHSTLPEADTSNQQDYHLDEPKKKKSKGKTFALVLFILLFLGAAGAAGWFYYQNRELQDQVDEKSTEIQRLEDVIYQLRYDIRDYANKQDLNASGQKALQDYADELKAACGESCDDITQ